MQNNLVNDTFLKALNREEVPYTPVWIMRQAGRYLPEYLKLRAKAGSFMNLCQDPHLACEVTIQPIERFNLDAAILFSDILTIPDAMGLGLYFAENEGPKFKNPIREYSDVEKIEPLCMDKLSYVTDAVSLIQKELDGKVPLIGFSGSPWTLATYMVEGGSSKDFRKIKAVMYKNPEMLHKLLVKLSDAVVGYLNAQIDAGVDAVQIFDTWGGVLPYEEMLAFDCYYNKYIVQRLKKVSNRNRKLSSIVFSKGCGHWIKDLVNIGSDALGLDWTKSMNQARLETDGKVALQGNMDPSVLYGSKDFIKQKVMHILDSYGQGPGHVFNLGHGVALDTDPDNVSYLIDCVHDLSKRA